MPEDIPLKPELPEALRDAAFRGKLVPFIGAGVSTLAGCPTWEQLADGALRWLVEQGHFTHAQLDQLKTLNPRIKLSIARGFEQQHVTPIPFKELLRSAARGANERGSRIYSSLWRLANTFVTTNYDEWLDGARAASQPSVQGGTDASATLAPAPRAVYFKRDDLTSAHLNQQNAVLHLHGSVNDPAGMVITTSDYVEHYRNDRLGEENPVLTFLENLFRTKHVLFIGYSLSELEILEYVILKTREFRTEGLQPRHFIVQGFFSHELELKTSLEGYYNQCGIGLLPFLKDHKGHEQLLDVIEDFVARAPAAPLMLADEFQEMERWLDD
ncbi:SIR2 family protein [Candidatus Uhrbacteria bacterium]|nr:SIR2 family protein [Candidatus Uhrbacteria bacterium]